MKTAAKLVAYAVVLALLLAGAWAIGSALGPVTPATAGFTPTTLGATPGIKTAPGTAGQHGHSGS